MLYEYSFDNLPREEIENMLKKSKEVRRIINNMSYYLVNISEIIFLLISFVANKFKWNNGNIILISAYLISMIRITFRKNINIKTYYEQLKKRIEGNQKIEINGDTYKYSRGKLTTTLAKHTIGEIIKSQNYTLIVVLPKKFKSILIFPFVISNNLFGSEEKYNDFINGITK